MRRRRLVMCATVLTIAMRTAARADDVALSSTNETVAPGLCSPSNPFATVGNLNEMQSACILVPRSFAFETVYLQNASRVGGTALAAYPLVTIRAGVVPRVQLMLDLPSAIAQSVPGGGGAFPVSHFGYGAAFAVSQSARSATALVAEVLPPDSRFTPAHLQSRYSLGIATSFAMTRRWTLGAQADGSSSARYGAALVSPAFSASASYTPSANTQIVTGLGTRISTRHGVAQSSGDIGVNRLLGRKLLFSVGVGTTFNAVNETKPHYLASGFTYRP